MCSLEHHCRNNKRDGTEYYRELTEVVDETAKIKEEMKKTICDQHLQSQPYND